MTRAKTTWAVLAAVAVAILLIPSDADGGRGSLKYGKKSRLKWDRNKWGGGDSYPGESRKSSADDRPKRREKAPPADHTVPAVPRGAPGTEVAALPQRAQITYAGGRRYHYAAGVFYSKSPGESGGYVIASPPYGAVVENLPSDFVEKTVGRTTYYAVDDTYYRRILRSDEVAYIVSKRP